MSKCFDPDRQLDVVKRFFAAIPHGAVLGVEAVEVTPEHLTTRIPYKTVLVGNPDTGVVHGGAITALVDQSCAGAIIAALEAPEPVVTLDLRLDHLRPAQPHRPIWARAQCYKLTQHIAFARCSVYQDSVSSPIATSMSTFMRAAQDGAHREEAI